VSGVGDFLTDVALDGSALVDLGWRKVSGDRISPDTSAFTYALLNPDASDLSFEDRMRAASAAEDAGGIENALDNTVSDVSKWFKWIVYGLIALGSLYLLTLLIIVLK